MHAQIKQSHEFLDLKRKYLIKYGSRIQKARVVFDKLIHDTKERDHTDFEFINAFPPEADMSSLFNLGQLNPAFQKHICHVSLRFSTERLPEINGRPYLAPFANLLSN